MATVEERAIEALQARQMWRRVMAILPDRELEWLILRFHAGMSPLQIADHWGTSHDNSYSAARALRERVRADGPCRAMYEDTRK